MHNRCDCGGCRLKISDLISPLFFRVMAFVCVTAFFPMEIFFGSKRRMNFNTVELEVVVEEVNTCWTLWYRRYPRGLSEQLEDGEGGTQTELT